MPLGGWRDVGRIQDSRNLALVSGSWSQQETGLPSLRHSALSTGRGSGACWVEASPGRMGSRTQWWYQTLKPRRTEEGKVHFVPPPFPNLLPLPSFPSDLDIWLADLFSCPALTREPGLPFSGLSLIPTFPWLIKCYRAMGKPSYPCWPLGYSPASSSQPTS